MTMRMQHTQFVIDPKLSALENFEQLPEGVLAEVINGKLYVHATPTTYHQRVSGRIFVDLYNFTERLGLGEVFSAPTTVLLAETDNIVIPDIIFIANSNKLIIDSYGLHGSPDLLIEMLSPTTRRHDRVTKKALYERYGVKEYWLVDPLSLDALGYFLEGDSYDEPRLMKSKIHIRLLNKTIQF